MPSPFTGPMWPGDPLMTLMMTGGMTNDPNLQDAAAHYLAMMYQPPPIPSRQQAPSGSSAGQAGGAGTGTGSTMITPPTRPSGDAWAGQSSSPLPTGDPTAQPPSTAGIQGSDGQSIQPPDAMSYAGSQPFNWTDYPYAGASPKDRGTWAGTEGGNTSQVGGQDDPGRMSGGDDDPTGTSNTGDKLGKIGTAVKDFSKSLAAVAPPADQVPKMANAPLPQHESRFTPTDLMTMIQMLSQRGAGVTQPQSLGALIGR